MTLGQLLTRLPGPEVVLGAVVQVLAGHCLIGSVVDDELDGKAAIPQRWVITELGRLCLAEVELAA